MDIGILGGTFDPVHNGHLAVARRALSSGLDLVLMMPAGDPWQKTRRNLTPAEHRLEMVRLAVADIPGLEVDDREVLRPGPTYTIDTLESFSSEHDLYLILGADSVLGIPTWHRSEDLLERAVLLIVPRPGVDIDAALAVAHSAVKLAMEEVDVSGTMIREALAAGRDVSGLVPAAVLEYIAANRLYTKAGDDDMVEPPNELEERS